MTLVCSRGRLEFPPPGGTERIPRSLPKYVSGRIYECAPSTNQVRARHGHEHAIMFSTRSRTAKASDESRKLHR